MCASSGAAIIRTARSSPDTEVPVFPTIASRFNDPGVNRLFGAVLSSLEGKGTGKLPGLPTSGEEVALGADRVPLARSADPERAQPLPGGDRPGRPACARAARGAVEKARLAYSAVRILEISATMLRSLRPLERYPDSAIAEGAGDATLRGAAAELQPGARCDRRRRRGSAQILAGAPRRGPGRQLTSSRFEASHWPGRTSPRP